MNKKIIKITEQELQNIVKVSVKKILHENYQMDSVDELMEFMWLRPKMTHLNVDIFVDDGQSYIRHKHELLLFVRNGYDKHVNEFIPFSVSQNPIVLDDVMDFNISYDDIFCVQDFILANLDSLQSLANRNISQFSFIQSIRIPSYALCERKEMLNEMSTLRKEDTNLPVDVWGN